MRINQITKLISLTALVLAVFILSTTANFAYNGCNWTGTWDTNLGPMNLVQQGNKVTGSFKERYFNVTGTVNGNYLRGYWYYSEVCEPEYYPLKLIMSRDCSSFDADTSDNLDPDGIDWEFYTLSGDRIAQKRTPRPPNYAPPSLNTGNKGYREDMVYVKNIPVNFLMDNNWKYERDEDNSLLFTSKVYPDSIAIYVINDVFQYNNNYERQLFLDAQKEEAFKMSTGEITTGSKPINGKDVNIIEVPQEDGIKTVIFFPDTGREFFMITVTFSVPEQMVTAETFLYSLMKGMVNSR